MEFSKVASLVLLANELGILDSIEISRKNGWITWYYGGLLDISKDGRIYFENDKVADYSIKDLTSLKARIRRRQK